MATDTTADKVRLCSEALTLINSSAITSFDDNTRGANMASLHYERIYRECLTMARWSFTRRYVALNRDASFHPDPKWGIFRNRFELPVDLINLIGVFSSEREADPITMYHIGLPAAFGGRLDGYTVAFELRDGYVYSDHRTICIDYQYRVPEDLLRHYILFRSFLVYRLAACFAGAVNNDNDTSAQMLALSEEYYQRAATTDASANPTEAVNFSLTASRMRWW